VQVAIFAGDGLAAASFHGKARSDLGDQGAAGLPPELTLDGELFLAREIRLAPLVRVAVFYSEEVALRPLSRLRRAILAVSALAMLMALILTWILARSLARPVADLVGLARAVRHRDLEARVVPSGGQELATLGQTMNEMVVELAQQRRRDELAGFLVHDLKNPLAVVLGNAEILMQARSSPAKAQVALQEILASAELMLGMVMDLLDAGRSADGRLVPRKTPFEVQGLLEEIRQRAAARAAWNGQNVVVAPGAVLTLTADRELVRRVIDNLLDNCFKYAPSGGTITLDGVALGASEVEIRVRDEGPGVPRELRERIFDKYFQLDRDVAERGRTSRGLGLVFCKTAVEAHGGGISVEDNQPRGSTFIIRLPLAP
jgi:two-component system, sensor histidine kinase and response regulator